MLVQSGFIAETEVARLRKAGAVGNSLGRFIDARGVVVDPALDGRIVGLDLEALCRKTVRLRQRLVTGEPTALTALEGIHAS